MPGVKVNDINVYYEIHNNTRKPAQSKYPLIMIQGLSANVHWWPEDLIDELSKSFKTIIFDNRGAGCTEKSGTPYSIKMFAHDTIGLMDALNIKRAFVLGISMGGMIAQEVALNYPERVEKLIICSSNCGGGEQIIPSKEVLDLLTKVKKGMTLDEVTEDTISLVFSGEFIRDNPLIIKKEKEKMMKYPIHQKDFFSQLKAIMRFSSADRLEKLNIPTLLMHGKKDILIPPENSEIMAKLIPNSKLVCFEDTAHQLFSQEPDIVTRTLIDFLEMPFNRLTV
ncbi:alpha/beta fold hydrolase [Spirochaetota bacterium]